MSNSAVSGAVGATTGIQAIKTTFEPGSGAKAAVDALEQSTASFQSTVATGSASSLAARGQNVNIVV